ncbi:lactate utilization protein [Flavisolibacter ginsenosidimutans]|uniref:Lactate utilization protein B/C n=2 Tax=Flavisolibacter ginsenosidimutans TaxID=661481 RepID=A0A5B8UJA7_9BACT|nr:lactate utilization protein B/C [Flavisolibacter ginsenosidimutans]
MSEARSKILNKIRMALASPTPLPFPQAEETAGIPVQPQSGDLVVEFAEQFSALQGKFVFCVDEAELKAGFEKLCYQNQWTKIYCEEEKFQGIVGPNSLHNDIASCEASITSCEALVARTGSIVLSSVHQGRIPSVYAPVHVCVAYTSQLVYDIKDALQAIKDKYRDYLPSLITLATGPSRTADIEKTLVVGVHGPKEVYCFVVDDQQ